MENSKIEWTDHTFNPWWGCMKVSPGCKNCYAEVLDNRWKGGHWGPDSSRKPMSDEYWQKPIKWNKDAEKAGKPAKVFCASMADVFENHPDVVDFRVRLFRLIESTPYLIWQLLTKRPENIRSSVPGKWLIEKWPDNVWIGTSVENQEAAEQRIPHLIRVPAKVRFLSCEPLLGPLSLLHELLQVGATGWLLSSLKLKHMRVEYPRLGIKELPEQPFQWVIAGGESGPKSRPVHPDWIRSIKDQCETAGVPFFFKQWGEYLPLSQWQGENINTFAGFEVFKHQRFFAEGKGKDVNFYRTGKKVSGSLLDGVEYKQFPVYISNNI
ncbi:phage Gp37/Gp68 family protein [Desertivirga xinjiangensis]|uniref:phage Gp37/Gp68 family protein n=1 Tax=Desertivirga xinjiangensis TaxID=539206 RepID=UPI00210A2BCF|nr:phage Gp37/Gp68 family protein [Pedobacter xinjiangensis]